MLATPEWVVERMRNPAKIGYEESESENTPDYDEEMVIISKAEYDDYRGSIAKLEADIALLKSEYNKLRVSQPVPKTEAQASQVHKRRPLPAEGIEL